MLRIIVIGLWGLCSQVLAEEEMYLEGISVMGEEKSAYLSLSGGKVQVHEGEKVGEWQVAKIEQQSIFLTTAQGQRTELRLYNRLPLVKESPVEATAPVEEEVNPGEVMEEEALKDKSEATTEMGDDTTTAKTESTDTTAETVKTESTDTTADDQVVPPGYRKVHTPFGDFTVREEEVTKMNSATEPSPATTTSPDSETTTTNNSETTTNSSDTATNSPELEPKPDPTPAPEPIPPGYRQIRTPFGTFLVEDKPKENDSEPVIAPKAIKEENKAKPTEAIKEK